MASGSGAPADANAAEWAYRVGSRAPAEGSAVGMSQGVCVRLCASRRNVVPGIESSGSLVVPA